MGYDLEAILFEKKMLNNVKIENLSIEIVKLIFGIFMIPLTEENKIKILQYNKNNQIDKKQNLVSENKQLPNDLTVDIEIFCNFLSQYSRIIYCDAEFFGGMGGQFAVSWEDRKILSGPFFTRINQPNVEYNVTNIDDMAINKCLESIGIKKGWFSDSFSRLGLNKFRHTNKWGNNE